MSVKASIDAHVTIGGARFELCAEGAESFAFALTKMSEDEDSDIQFIIDDATALALRDLLTLYLNQICALK